MSFSFISKISLYLSFIFIFSCQDTISSLRNNENIGSDNYNFQLETEDSLDFSLFQDYQNNAFDNYTYIASDYKFVDKDLNVLKINNTKIPRKTIEKVCLILIIFGLSCLFHLTEDKELHLDPQLIHYQL